ncbi:hypothetical protein EWM64_g9451 [Hericium alpestre]|uniref:BTB domain-containing protein n=1 Tax=Hericium alpestre TaxID=135208 RepID=A0A4Y9ZKX4_9AGAM|nr:hypothetical protein EWM64_g9451 [Hericium alpestre]
MVEKDATSAGGWETHGPARAGRDRIRTYPHGFGSAACFVSPLPTQISSSNPYMLSASQNSSDLQVHLYSSFLERKTADIALRVRGTWEAVYKLHRVVLIQAGFFRSLFTGGFVESTDRTTSSRRNPHLIEIVFDDTNITRAAFELCISRLYGGGPPTYISPSVLPTPAHPLTPQFTMPYTTADTPEGHQPASPRFLLSVLSTAIYLSIPSVATQALTSILNSVGPFTVVPYLDFAIGRGIGPLQDGDLDAAVGLEHVADLKVPRSEPQTGYHTPHGDAEVSRVDEAARLARTLEAMSVKDDAKPDRTSSGSEPEYFVVKKEDPAETSSDDHSFSDHEHELHFHYGAVSDKIGEAATCWLARWGIDMLAFEQQAVKDNSKRPAEAAAAGSSNQPHLRRSTMPSSWDHTPFTANKVAPSVVPLIWRREGLTAKWVKALISSDSLFVRGERERYDMAKAIVEMRRAEGINDEEEEIWTTMFAEGIYYRNMHLEDLIYITQDVSPTTGRLYTPLDTIQSAHWNQSLLQHRIMGRTSSSSSPPSSPTAHGPRDKELGIALSSSEILDLLSSPAKDWEKDRPYWPVLNDSSSRVGDGAGIEGASMDELFELPSATDPKRTVRSSHSESSFFGLKSDRCLASACPSADPNGTTRWLPHPPYRFAVEFWDVEALREKSRLHSHTIWYGGSLFNVYVQVVRKKGIQLGVYLHRQSSVDPIPPPSAPYVYRVDRAEKDRIETRHARSPSSPTSVRPSSSPSTASQYSAGSPLGSSRSTTPTSTYSGNSPSLGQSLPATGTPCMPAQPYRDPRPSVSAYFTISCASATGSSLTKFTSSPDVFSVSQSWGWKSSSLRTEEYLEVGAKEAGPTSPMPAEKEVSLRVTVVLGLI